MPPVPDLLSFCGCCCCPQVIWTPSCLTKSTSSWVTGQTSMAPYSASKSPTNSQ